MLGFGLRSKSNAFIKRNYNLGYTYTQSGGNATITDYDPLVGGTTLVIPEELDGYPVIAIADNAIRDNGIKKITFNHAVDVGDYSFRGNSGLQVVLNANLTTVAVLSDSASPFYGCSIGNKLTIGSGVTTIARGLFYNCGITSVTIGSGVTEIGQSAFENNSLTALTIPTNVTSLKSYCFKGNSIDNLEFNHAIAMSGVQQFMNNGAINITINANIDCTGIFTSGPPFENCTATVTITTNVTSIGKYLLGKCGLTSIIIRETVTSIGNNALYSNAGLASIVIKNNACTFGSNVLQSNMSADPKGMIYAFDGSTADTWWTASYTGTYNFTNIDQLISECDTTDDFDYIYGCAKALDTGNKQSGTGSVVLTKNADAAGYFVADIDGTFDFSKNVNFQHRLYSADKSNLATIGIILFTTAGKSYDDSYRYYVAGSSLANGWNSVSVALSAFTKYGSGNLSSITSVRFIISLNTDNQTEVVNLDLIKGM
jgi:hypothetical protein